MSTRQVVRTNIDLDLLIDLRVDEYRAESGVCHSSAHSNQTAEIRTSRVDTDLGPQQPVRILPLHRECRTTMRQRSDDPTGSESVTSAYEPMLARPGRKYMRSSISVQSLASVSARAGVNVQRSR